VAGLAFSEWRDAAADAGYYEVRRTEHLRRPCTTQHNESTATIHFITGSMLLKYVFLLVTLCSAAAAQCTVTLNPSSVHLSSAKSTGTFAISASTANCPRTVKSNSDWISIAFGQTGSRSFAMNARGTVWQIYAATPPPEPFGPPATTIR